MQKVFRSVLGLDTKPETIVPVESTQRRGIVSVCPLPVK
jgi:hypothetical protein